MFSEFDSVKESQMQEMFVNKELKLGEIMFIKDKLSDIIEKR